MIPVWAWVDTDLTAEECELLVKYGTDSLEVAGTGNNDVKKRQGKVSWFVKDRAPEIEPLLQRCVNAFGFGVKEHFGPSLKAFEPIQFTHYEPGDFYGWHYDAHAVPGRSPRHFSATVELCDPKSYSGGGLEFHSIEDTKPEKKQGRMIIFPSMLLHRAMRVDKGNRSSLVIWGRV